MQTTQQPIIDESSNSSSTDSALHHPPEPQNSENSFNQSSEGSGVSHDSRDPSWSPPSQNNSSHTTDSSLSYSTAVAIADHHGGLTTSKKSTNPGTAQDAQRNVIGSGNALRKRENESHNMQSTESYLYDTTAVCNNSKQLAKKCASSGGVVPAKSGPGVAVQERETENQKSADIQAATLAAPESSKKSNSLAQNPKRNHSVRPHAIYHLVAQPKKGKKPNSIASSTFSALIDITNRGTGVGGKEGRKRQASSTVATTSSSTALDVFDYGQGTPAKLAGSKCRSNATGQLV